MARAARRNAISAIFTPKHPYLPGTELLRQVDVDALAEQLDLAGRGRADAEAGLPAADGRSLSAAERDIVSQVRGVWTTTVEGARRAYDGYRGRLASLTTDADIDALIAQPKAVALTLQETAREERDGLVAAFVHVREAREELARFRLREGLERPARPTQATVTKIALLSLAALAELIVNTSIFAGGDEFGFVGAITKVVVIPVVNIGGCWLWTHWLARHILGRSPLSKLVGLAGCVLAVSWLLALNLAVAHWRDAAAAGLSLDAAQASLTAALAHPLQLRSFQSWGLFLIGCFAGAVAIFEGWFWDDPHPGYGRRARAAQAAAEDWREQRAGAIDRLQAIADDNVRALDDSLRRAELAIAERPALAEKVVGLSQDLTLYADHLHYVAQELAARYREANLAARGGDRPANFNVDLPLAFEAPTLEPLPPGTRRFTQGRLSTAISEITAALAAAWATIPALTDLDGTGPR